MAHSWHPPKFVLLVGLFAILMGGALCIPLHAADTEVAILCSHRAAPYEQTIEGFKAYVSGCGIRANFQVVQLEGERDRAEAAVQQVKAARPGLVLALGAIATHQAAQILSDVPVVAGLILTTEEIEARKNITGVILNFPLEMQFQWLLKILPKSRNVGALYNKERNSRRIEEAVRVAQDMGLKLHAQPVTSPSEIPRALEAIAKQVDVIWGIPDDMVYTPQTAKHILLFSFRSSIPVIGLSDAWVKAGALYALEWDYRDLGKQCGEIAEEILKGNKFNLPRPRWPRTVRLSVNKKTAARLNVKLQEGVLGVSSLIHE